jgi:hypothetical protein
VLSVKPEPKNWPSTISLLFWGLAKVTLLDARQLGFQSFAESGEAEMLYEKKWNLMPTSGADKDTNHENRPDLSGLGQDEKALAEFLYSASA